MSDKSKFSSLVEYATLRTACAVVNAIPYGLACSLAKGIAATAITCGFRKQRTLERIQSCFPEKSRAEALSIARESLANVLMSGIEMIRAPRLNHEWISQHVKDVQVYADCLREVMDEGKGAVIMVPHSGNWYMAAWAMAQYGLPLSAIAARQRNPYVDAWMKRQYGSIDVLERGSASVMRDILNLLKQGRGFAILPDLRVPALDVEVPFLNGTANVSHGGAMFSVSTGAPIVVAIMRRENGLHTFEHLATLRPRTDAPDRKQEARRLTAEALRLLNDAICKTPGQWFWYNKRWILQPVKKTK